MNDIYYSANDYRSYIEHHGVAGQKWGQRNGPPYPLKPNEHSAAEKKAGWRKSLENDGSDSNRKRVAKDSTKYLNQIDKKNAFNKRYYDDEIDKIASLKKHGSKLDKRKSEAYSKEEKQLIQKKIDVNNAKIKSAEEAGKKLMNDISANQKAINDIESYLKKNGYDINEKAKRRNVNTKTENAINFGVTFLAYAAGTPGIVRNRRMAATRYKVRNQ